MAIFLQALSARLGIATGRDSRASLPEHYSRRTTLVLWVLCEIAIAACDLAEVLGSRIALKLLFGLRYSRVLLTGLDVLLVLALQGRGFRVLETLVITLMHDIAACFAYEIFFARRCGSKRRADFFHGRNPEESRDALSCHRHTRRDCDAAQFVLHSSLVQTRALLRTRRGSVKRYVLQRSTQHWHLALTFYQCGHPGAGAAAFHQRGMTDVADISQAYQLLTPVLGASLASVFLRRAAMLGQNSTLTGTLPGRSLWRDSSICGIKPWLRRLITRSLASPAAS